MATKKKAKKQAEPEVPTLVQEHDPEELLDPADAAKFLRVKPQTLAVWRCRKRYGLRFIPVGRLIKYQRRDLIAFINRRAVSGS